MSNQIFNEIPPDIHLRHIINERRKELKKYSQTPNASQFYIQKQIKHLEELQSIENKIAQLLDKELFGLDSKVVTLRKIDANLTGVVIHLSWKPGNNIAYLNINTGGGSGHGAIQ